MSERKIEVVKKEPARMPPGAERQWVKLDGELFSVLISHDEFSPIDKRWHISVSRNADLEAGNDEVAIWRDLVAIVHFVRPGVNFVVPLPARSMWMNANPNVLHAYESKDDGLATQIRISAEQVRGTPMAVPS